MPKDDNRPLKGYGSRTYMKNYTVIDIETTGLSPSMDSIIELSAIRVRAGKPAETYSSLVNPHLKLSDFITGLTGITNDMLSTAPDIDVVLPEFLTFVGSDWIVGYNVSFDINFVYDKAVELGLPAVSNNYIDVRRLAYRDLAGLRRHRLCDVAAKLGIAPEVAHRGLADCQTTYECYVALEAISKSAEPRPHHEHTGGSDWAARAKDFTAACEVDENSPILGLEVVVTGTLSNMSRKEFMQFVADHGGVNRDTVTKDTTYLVIGTADYYNFVRGQKSGKIKKAEQRILKGQDLTIIDEKTFFDMFADHDEE